MHNTDWPSNNWRAARRRDVPVGDTQGKFRFFVWDAEISMSQATLSQDYTGISGGVAQVHSILINHPSYKQKWKDRVALHLDTAGGVFSVSGGIHSAVTRFADACTLLDGASLSTGGLLAEQARWGDGGGAVLGRSQWIASTDYRRVTWIPSRRAAYRTHLVNRGLANP
jgi:hypothetical protein